MEHTHDLGAELGESKQNYVKTVTEGGLNFVNVI